MEEESAKMSRIIEWSWDYWTFALQSPILITTHDFLCIIPSTSAENGNFENWKSKNSVKNVQVRKKQLILITEKQGTLNIVLPDMLQQVLYLSINNILYYIGCSRGWQPNFYLLKFLF